MKTNRSTSNLMRLIVVIMLLLITSLAVAGCQKQEELEIPVVAEFTATPTSGSAPLTVQFTDQATGDISQWWWFFGDGYGSTQQNPSHTYTGEGIYTVYLVVVKPDDSHEAQTKEAYIRVGNPALGEVLTIQEASYRDYEIPIESEFVTLDVAGEGVLYWTSFIVKDKDEVDWTISRSYEHSIYIDYVECWGAVDAAGEIWEFQQKEERSPGSLYPAIYSRDRDTTTEALWRINVPFHKVLALISINKDFWGIGRVEMCHTVYSLVGSGVPGSRGGRHGEEWSIKKTSDELEFPVADKIKTALENEFGKKVYSVGIVRHPPTGDSEAYSLLWVDAPEIESNKISGFLHASGLIEFAPEQK